MKNGVKTSQYDGGPNSPGESCAGPWGKVLSWALYPIFLVLMNVWGASTYAGRSVPRGTYVCLVISLVCCLAFN